VTTVAIVTALIGVAGVVRFSWIAVRRTQMLVLSLDVFVFVWVLIRSC